MIASKAPSGAILPGVDATLGCELTLEEAEQILNEVDITKKGRISFEQVGGCGGGVAPKEGRGRKGMRRGERGVEPKEGRGRKGMRRGERGVEPKEGRGRKGMRRGEDEGRGKGTKVGGGGLKGKGGAKGQRGTGEG